MPPERAPKAYPARRHLSLPPELYVAWSMPEEAVMIFDYALAGVVTVGLLIYLTYALLRPDRF